MDSRNCQTSTATPAEPGGLPLTLVSQGTVIRLLTREKIASLVPAANLFNQQSGTKIEVRAASGFHDRFVFIDQAYCYQSGASFKDGAKKAPTTLTMIKDAFQAVLGTYESIWTGATIHVSKGGA